MSHQKLVDAAPAKGAPEEEPSAKKRKRRPGSHRGFGWTLVHLFGSLKLAMLLFSVIILASIIGTIQESRFDARVAQYKIFDATWFTFWLGILCINLAAAALTRWPWKKRHTGFVITHSGIIILLIGSIIGRHAGIEGSLTLRVGEEPKAQLFIADMALHFWDRDTGQVFRTPFPVDMSPPSEESPRYYPLPGREAQATLAPFSRIGTRLFGMAPSEPTLVVDRFSEELLEETRLLPAPGSGIPGVRLELTSAMIGGVPMEVKLVAEPAEHSFYSLGDLAQISLGESIVRTFDEMESPSPLMQLRVTEDGDVEYHVINSRGEKKEGSLSVGDKLVTGWADWTATVHEILPDAQVETVVVEGGKDNPGGLTGIRASIDWGDGQTLDPIWYLAGDMHTARVAGEEVRFAFGYRTETLPFNVKLLAFEVPRDEGTDNPSNFRSYLRFTDPVTGATADGSCGMNTPALFPTGFHRLVTGFTYKFSQASWNPDDLSESTVQVLRDPGWLFKWMGSLIIVVGIYMIFFWRPYRNRRPEDIIDDI